MKCLGFLIEQQTEACVCSQAQLRYCSLRDFHRLYVVAKRKVYRYCQDKSAYDTSNGKFCNASEFRSRWLEHYRLSIYEAQGLVKQEPLSTLLICGFLDFANSPRQALGRGSGVQLDWLFFRLPNSILAIYGPPNSQLVNLTEMPHEDDR